MGSLRGQDGFRIENSPEGEKIITLKGPSRVIIAPAIVKKDIITHE